MPILTLNHEMAPLTCTELCTAIIVTPTIKQ